MKFNLHSPVLQYNGKAMEQPNPDNPSQMEPVNFRTVINAALNNQPQTAPGQPQPPIDAETGAKIYHLTNKIWHSWKVELSTPEKALIMERALQSFPADILIRGRLEDFLEGDEPMVPLPEEDQDKELEEASEPVTTAKR